MAHPGNRSVMARVRISGPSSVTAIECSKWAARDPSAVTTVQSSGWIRVS
jgi:hypothetical protein